MKRSTSTPSPPADPGAVAAPATKAVAPGSQRPGARFSPREAALVLVDWQRDFCHPEGTMGRRGLDLSRVEPAVTNAERLLTAARAAGVPVVFVRTAHGPHLDSPEWTHRYSDGVGPGFSAAAPNCVEGTWGAEFHRVTPLPGELVWVKHRYSAFHAGAGAWDSGRGAGPGSGSGPDKPDKQGSSPDPAPGLAERLTALGRRSLVFAGVTTSVCVESSLRAAVDADFLGSVVPDACADYRPDWHTAAVTAIAAHFGKAVPTDQLVGHWRAHPPTTGGAPGREPGREEVKRDA